MFRWIIQLVNYFNVNQQWQILLKYFLILVHVHFNLYQLIFQIKSYIC